MTYKHFLGDFKTLSDVWEHYPSGGQEGDYLNIDGEIYRWNQTENQWTVPAYTVPGSSRQTDGVKGDLNVENNLSVGGILRARVVRGRSASCGLFVDEAALTRHFPKPLVGQWALVMIDNRTDEDGNAIGEVYVCEEDGAWKDAGYRGGFDGEYDALLTEKEERQENDAYLKGLIDDEVQARENSIEQEKRQRQNGDNDLARQISNEALARERADNAEMQARIEAINAEKHAREEADNEEMQRAQDAERQIVNLIREKEKALYDAMVGLKTGGTLLQQVFGNSPIYGISQKAITDAINKLWQKIEDITGESLQGISLTVTPGYYIGEEGADIHISANTVETNGIFEHIAFYINGTLIAQADNVESFEADTEITETSVVKCVAKILGVEYERQEVVTHYNSFWLGAGTSYSDVMTVSNLRPITNGMRGAYDIEAAEDDHIIIVVGESLAQGFIRADLNGFEIPFTESTVTIDGKNYKVFTSEDTYIAGTYNIDING